MTVMVVVVVTVVVVVSPLVVVDYNLRHHLLDLLVVSEVAGLMIFYSYFPSHVFFINSTYVYLDISSSQQVNLSNAKSPIDDDWAFCMIIHDIYYQAKIKAFLEKVLTF